MQEAFTLFLMLYVNFIKSNEEETNKIEKAFPYFRLKMEEVFGDQVHESVDESSDNFVSFLLDNVKELFVPSETSTIITHEQESLKSESLLDIFRTSTNFPILRNSLITDNYDPRLPFLQIKSDIDRFNSNIANKTDKELTSLLTKLEPIGKTHAKDISFKVTRTCIACDNILNEDCTNPKFKLVPTVDCKREGDRCYSQHTPFGIINRGCIDVDNDISIYVCACNRCNYLSISEMPYMFSNKRDWVRNIIELSRAKRLRESIFKDMSCLRCEVNVTAKKRYMIADADCLEGNIATLPSQTCTADEICAVKAVRSEGYVWRGCVSEPLYNYWWTLCDNDWCNYDTLVSIYDTIN